jgi:hypothetical protein
MVVEKEEETRGGGAGNASGVSVHVMSIVTDQIDHNRPSALASDNQSILILRFKISTTIFSIPHPSALRR